METPVTKLVFASLMMLFVLPVSAFAIHPVCVEYNEFVAKQCVSASKLKKDLDPEMLKDYTVQGCRNNSFKSALEADLFASESCKPVMKGKLISALK